MRVSAHTQRLTCQERKSPPNACVRRAVRSLSSRRRRRGDADDRKCQEAVANRRRVNARSRSSSVMPPHTPYGSRTASACAAHSRTTGHVAHTALAASSLAMRAGPRSPSGWKNTPGSSPRQAACICQSQRSALGPGSRDTSATGGSLHLSPGGARTWRPEPHCRTAPDIGQVFLMTHK
jgi:hypothetical protein